MKITIGIIGSTLLLMLMLFSQTTYAYTTDHQSTAPLLQENRNPNPPEITGPTNGKANKIYSYSFYLTDPDGDTLTAILIEWGGTEESLFFTVQMPHSWKGTDIKAHVHWSPTAGTEEESSIVWGLEYTWANIDATFGNTTLITATDTGTFAEDAHYVCGLGTIPASGKTASSMLLCRVYRAATSSSDDYASDAALLEIDFHYQVESLGSETAPSN